MLGIFTQSIWRNDSKFDEKTHLWTKGGWKFKKKHSNFDKTLVFSFHPRKRQKNDQKLPASSSKKLEGHPYPPKWRCPWSPRYPRCCILRPRSRPNPPSTYCRPTGPQRHRSGDVEAGGGRSFFVHSAELFGGGKFHTRDTRIHPPKCLYISE